jgi:hypothetical protein
MSIRLTESRLRQIIREEARRTLSESWRDMPGPGDSSPDEADSLDGDTTCLKCTRQHGRIVVDNTGLRNDDAEDVQDMLNNYDPDSAKDLMRLLNEIGIEKVECDGETMSIYKFIDSL